MLWAKVWVGNLLARWWVDVATAVHFYEAILATLAIIVWHFYQVFLRSRCVSDELGLVGWQDAPSSTTSTSTNWTRSRSGMQTSRRLRPRRRSSLRLSTICQRIFGYPMNRDNYSDVDDEGDGLQPVLCGIKRFSALAAEGTANG